MGDQILSSMVVFPPCCCRNQNSFCTEFSRNRALGKSLEFAMSVCWLSPPKHVLRCGMETSGDDDNDDDDDDDDQYIKSSRYTQTNEYLLEST